MSKTAGRQVEIGVGIEAVPGTPVAETAFLQHTAFSMQGISEKEMFASARGIRNTVSNSMIKRKYSGGSIGVIPNVVNAPYMFGLALGSVSTTGPVDSAYEHTITVQNANASMKTATLTVAEGAIQTAQYSNVVVNSLSLEVSDGYATMTAELLGQFPGTDTQTESYTQETEFAYHNYVAKFGTSVANANSGSATPLKGFSLTINNNVQLDEAFLSGSNEITASGLVAGTFEVTGSYTLHFEDTVELAKYKANTKNAMVIIFTGGLIGASEAEEINIALGKLILTDQPIEYNIDGLLVLTQTFTTEYDATDKEITVVVTNEEIGTDY